MERSPEMRIFEEPWFMPMLAAGPAAPEVGARHVHFGSDLYVREHSARRQTLRLRTGPPADPSGEQESCKALASESGDGVAVVLDPDGVGMFEPSSIQSLGLAERECHYMRASTPQVESGSA